MEQGQLNWIANFIWGIADDVLRDLYVRGKYRDVILPMTVLRRLDDVLEPTKQAVLDMKASLDQAAIRSSGSGPATGVLQHLEVHLARDLKARASQQQLRGDFEAIVALPLNMFYNTGIATYIWVLTNRKPTHRQGKVQLIDSSTPPSGTSPCARTWARRTVNCPTMTFSASATPFLPSRRASNPKSFPTPPSATGR
jgi:type I restriction-modification system DNA methylase subunit